MRREALIKVTRKHMESNSTRPKLLQQPNTESIKKNQRLLVSEEILLLSSSHLAYDIISMHDSRAFFVIVTTSSTPGKHIWTE